VTDAEPTDRELFYRGLERFNAGRWFDAHEEWEDLWHRASGNRKRFIQALIQCAVAIEHVRRGNPRGVRSVWTSASAKLAGFDGEAFGFRVRDIERTMADYLRPILELPSDRFAPGRSRGQDLPVDLDAAPRFRPRVDPFANGDTLAQTPEIMG
jgi:hypothetical protein